MGTMLVIIGEPSTKTGAQLRTGFEGVQGKRGLEAADQAASAIGS